MDNYGNSYCFICIVYPDRCHKFGNIHFPNKPHGYMDVGFTVYTMCLSVVGHVHLDGSVAKSQIAQRTEDAGLHEFHVSFKGYFTGVL